VGNSTKAAVNGGGERTTMRFAEIAFPCAVIEVNRITIRRAL